MRIFFLTIALILGGCSTLQLPGTQPSQQSNLSRLAQFTIADLTNADADAVSHNDQIAHMCYPVLIRFIADLQMQNAGLTVSGAIGAFQRARDLQNTINAGLPDYLVIGCSPLFVDANAMLARIAAIGLVVP